MSDQGMTHDVQVQAAHYLRPSYLFPERWASYWHQIDAVRSTKPARVLEIGVGNGIVAQTLSKIGIAVDTLDIDPELRPTYVGSLVQMPLPDGAYDTVLCAEVLEHLPWEQFRTAVAEIHRVASKHAVITVPHAGYVFSVIFKLPLLPTVSWCVKLPFFWQTHEFNGQHYWESGKRGYSRARIRREIEKAGFRVRSARIHPDSPAHFCLICDKV